MPDQNTMTVDTLRTDPIGVNQTTYAATGCRRLNHCGDAIAGLPWREAGLPYYSCNFSCASGSAGGCKKSASTPASPAPMSMARSPPAAARSATTAASAPAAACRGPASAGRSTRASPGCGCATATADDFLAYFQPATNTYAPVERLRPFTKRRCRIRRSSAWRSARGPIACRTTCSTCCSELGRQRHRTCAVEFGMQTMHDRSLDWMNRGHHHDAMLDAVERSRGRGFEIGAHVILGLPGESHDDMLATAREVGRLGSTP